MKLGRRETQILKALWELEAEAPVAEVLQQLQAAGAAVTYNTVQTMLNRMVDKGVAVREKRGRAFFYAPRLPLEAVGREQVGETIDRYFDGSARALAVHLVDHELDDGELAALEALIARRRRERS